MARIPDRFAQVTPYFFVKDAGDYMDYLIAALGGEEGGRTMRGGMLANGIIHFGEASIMVSEAAQGFPPSQAATYFYVDNADAAMARALEHGMEEIFAAADMDYGDRQGGVRDRAGNLWWISERLTDAPYHA